MIYPTASVSGRKNREVESVAFLTPRHSKIPTLKPASKITDGFPIAARFVREMRINTNKLVPWRAIPRILKLTSFFMF
jgi:hypothetical protein